MTGQSVFHVALNFYFPRHRLIQTSWLFPSIAYTLIKICMTRRLKFQVRVFKKLKIKTRLSRCAAVGFFLKKGGKILTLKATQQRWSRSREYTNNTDFSHFKLRTLRGPASPGFHLNVPLEMLVRPSQRSKNEFKFISILNPNTHALVICYRRNWYFSLPRFIPPTDSQPETGSVVRPWSACSFSPSDLIDPVQASLHTRCV
jgi:hypothetical protein